MLEVGSGSGYSTSVLALLAREVIGIELLPVLAAAARRAIGELGLGNVEVIVGDGGLGLPDRAPFDAIAVHAAAPAEPRTLLGQLAEGGRLVVPIATGSADVLTVFRRQGDRLDREEIGPCRFVRLLGAEGFAR